MDKSLMSIFWSLAEGTDEEREKAAALLVDVLDKKQTNNEGPSKELEYTLKRLVKGLSSNRKWARLGFATALTQVLRQFDCVTIAHVQHVIKEELKLLKSDSKGERSNILLGRIMTCLSIVHSDKIMQANGSEIQTIAESFYKVKNDKPPLHHVCTQGLVQLIFKISENNMESHVLPVLKEDLQAGWKDCQPDTLLLLLTAMKHKDVFNKKFFSEHWDAKRLICATNMKEIGSVLAKSTSDHPIIHPVCNAVLTEVVKKPETFMNFWTTVVNEFLLKQTLPKKFLSFQLVPIALTHVTSADLVRVILSDNLISLLMKHMPNKEQPLYSASRRLAHLLVSAMNGGTAEVQVAIVTRLVQPPGGVLFDTFTKTTTLSNLIRHLNGEASEQFADLLMDTVCGGNDLGHSETVEHDVICKWAVQTLTSMVTQASKAMDGDWQLCLLQFLFIQGFCHIKKTTGDIVHCDKHLRKRLQPHTLQLLQESFFRALNRLATYSPGKYSKYYLHYTAVLQKLVKYVQVLLTSEEHVKLNKELSKESLQHWNKILHLVGKIQDENKKSEKMSEGHAFELLLLHMGLQLFTDPKGAAEALEDLYVCFEKAFQKKKKQSSAEDEPEWIEVVTDLLLSLLSQHSHLLRTVVNAVFTILSPHLTKGGLILILDVLKSNGTDEESALDFEDDMQEAEMDEDEGIEENMEEDDENDEESSEDDDSDDNGDDIEEVDEQWKAKLKQALGKAATGSGDEESEDEDLSDSEMEKLDDTLAATFRSMKKGKKDEKAKRLQLKHYKMRCLDLLEILTQQDTPAGFFLEILEPLLQLLDDAQKEKDMRDLYQRASNVYHSVVATRKMTNTAGVNKNDLPQRIQELITLSTKVTGVPMILEVGKAILFVIIVMLDMDTNVPPPVLCLHKKSDTDNAAQDRHQDLSNLDKVHTLLKQSIQDYCQKRESLLNHMLFHVILEKQPVLMWPLFNDLLELAQKDSIRVFCRTHVCSMMASMISKNTVTSLGDTTWTEYAVKITSQLTGVLSKALDEKHAKPKFLHDVLLVQHKVFQCSSDELLEKIVPEQFLEKVEATKDRLKSKDIKGICNKLSQLIKRRLHLEQGQSKRKEKQKRKLEMQYRKDAKIPKLQEGNSINEGSDAGVQTDSDNESTEENLITEKETAQEKSGKKSKKSKHKNRAKNNEKQESEQKFESGQKSRKHNNKKKNKNKLSNDGNAEGGVANGHTSVLENNSVDNQVYKKSEAKSGKKRKDKKEKKNINTVS